MIPNMSAKYQLSSISDLKYFEGSWLETWRTWVITDLITVLHIWFPTRVPNFWIIALLKVCQVPPCHHQSLEDIEGSWLETWRTWVILDLIIVFDIGFLTSVPNFRILAWLEVYQEPWRTWVIHDLIIDLDTWFLTCVQNVSILAWLEVCQEPPSLMGIP